MLVLRRLQRLKHAFALQRNSSVLRGIAAAADEPPRTEDVLVKMENPYKQPQQGCVLCGVAVDFKNIQLLSQFISPHTGRIYGRHVTGLCGRKQKEVSKAVKRAHSMGFMSVTHKHPQLMKDPSVCGVRQTDS